MPPSLLAIDLRQSYDEWYDRQMFSEAAQQGLLQSMQRIVDARRRSVSAPSNEQRTIIGEELRAARAEVLACGKAAVPMLRRAVMEVDAERVEESIDLLFRLGVLPPTAVLARTDSWIGDVDAWRLLLRDRASATPMPATADRSLRATLLAAALRGPAALREVILADELPPGCIGLHIESRLNGRVMQSASTSDMVFHVAPTIALMSACMTLEPGDVIVMGTPAGVGYARKPPVWMVDGDVIEIDIEGIGVLRNQVRAQPA